jgi:hypothetical protein
VLAGQKVTLGVPRKGTESLAFLGLGAASVAVGVRVLRSRDVGPLGTHDGSGDTSSRSHQPGRPDESSLVHTGQRGIVGM